MQIDKQLIEEIISQIHKKDNVEEIFDKIEAEILFLLKAGRFTVYKRADNGREICSFYMSSSDFASPIILPITSSSIAGYVAQSEKSLSIADVYDSEELVGIHPHLSFDHSYDRESGYLSESMIAVPIVTTNGLEGVLQVLGYSEGGAFPPELLDACVEITDALATKFRSVLKSSLGPYQFLAEEGIISIEKLQEAKKLAQQLNKTLSYILKDRYELSTKVIANCLSDYYQVPFVNSSTLRSAPQSLMDNLNRNFLAGLVWVPIKRDNNGVRVAMEDPSNNELINEIRTVLKVKNVEVCVGLPEDILLHIGLNQFGEQGIATEDVENIIESISFDDGVTGETVADLMDTDATSIIRLVNKIITDAVRMNASDIHIEPVVDKPGIVRMRVDGICRKVVDIPENLIKAVIARVKILSNLDIAEKRKPQDGKMTVRMGGVPLELRIATLPVVAGESVVMRILQRGLPLSFNKLSLSERNETFIHSFLESSHGLILVVGPTGSGKTTTLHAILYLLNNEERKILTVEDPVEIVQDGLQQVQISPKAGVTFSFALRAFLRCDPDIILIGEMRDLETASIGIEASLTGHLVFFYFTYKFCGRKQ